MDQHEAGEDYPFIVRRNLTSEKGLRRGSSLILNIVFSALDYFDPPGITGNRFICEQEIFLLSFW